jgi:hypothetical protein
MTVCFRGKKSKISQTISKRSSSDEHNDLDHQSTLTTHINHHKKNSNMPHDLSRSSANSASSSALSYSNSTSQSAASNNATNNHYYHKKSDKMDISDDDDDDDDESTTADDSKKQKKLKRTLDPLTPAQQKHSIVNADMIFYCFEILGNHLFNGKHHVPSSSTSGQLIPSSITPPAVPSEPYPLFVTWFIGTDKQLRGCIGTFSPMDLAHGKFI